MQFKDLNLISPIIKALDEVGYKIPTPVQEQSIGVILDGSDLLGTAQTGTGKTAAFALPILQKLQSQRNVPKECRLRALVLSPTRELAIQTKDNFIKYGRHLRLRCAAVYGGVSQIPQVRALRSGTDILVATPGRLLDLLNQKVLNLDCVNLFVLDEADHMLDMGFIQDVRKIIDRLPAERQTMLFSATMPREISNLANSILKDPKRVAISPVTSTVDNVEQFIYFVEKRDKTRLLIHLLKNEDVDSALVFTRTKHGADRVNTELLKAGIKSDAIHGDKSQSARQLSLRKFKYGKTKVLVATDIAARGIDVVQLSHVVNYDLPDVPETYIHRIGRTGRAGQSGSAFSFCDRDETGELADIEKLIKRKIPVVTDHPYAADISAKPVKKPDFNKFRAYNQRKKRRNYSTRKPVRQNDYKRGDKVKTATRQH